MKTVFLKYLTLFLLLTTTIFATDGTKTWEFQTGNWVASSPAIGADGEIYIVNDSNKLFALDSNGSQKWTFGANDTIWFSPCVAGDGTIYVGSGVGSLYALNPDGSQKWKYSFGDYINSAPFLGKDGTIYASFYSGSSGSIFSALNPDGSEKWRYDVACYSGAVGGDGTIYVLSDSYKLFALNSSGTKKWEKDLESSSMGYSLISIGSDNTIYVVVSTKLYALNSDGTTKWIFDTQGDMITATPTIGSDGTVYVANLDGKVFALNPDGSQRWKFDTQSAVSYSSPTVGSDGVVYVGATDGKLYALNPDGTKKWEFQTGDDIFMSTPAIANNGTLYIGSTDGKLYAIQTSSLGLANSPWPRYGHDNKNTGNISLEGRNATAKQKIAGLYIAFFNRAPDYSGLTYWDNLAKSEQAKGNSPSAVLKELARGFASHPVFTQTYGGMTNQQFVEAIYKNVLGKDGDSEGIAYWTSILDQEDPNKFPYMVSTFVEVSLTLSITQQNFPTLSQSDIEAAQERQNLLIDKVNVAINFVDKLGTKTNVADTQNPEEDPAYKASVRIISKVTSDVSTVKSATDFLDSIKSDSDSVAKILLEWGETNSSKIISSLDSIGDISNVALKGDTLFAGGSEGILYVINISNKASPSIIATLDTQDIIEDIKIDTSTNRLFLANNQKGLSVVDISDPSSPSIVKSIISGYARAISIDDSTIYVASGYDGINMFSLSTYEKTGNIPVSGSYTDSVEVYKGYAFTSDAYDRNITISDISTKAKVGEAQKEVSNYEARSDITISSDTMFVADLDAGLMIFDASNLPSVTLLSTTPPSIVPPLDNAGYSFNVTLSKNGTKAFVCASYPGVDIYDISDITNPKIVETVDTAGNAFESVLSDDGAYLFVADRAGGLQIIELGTTMDK